MLELMFRPQHSVHDRSFAERGLTMPLTFDQMWFALSAFGIQCTFRAQTK